MICPHCRARLSRARSPKGILWVCGRCRGRAVGVGLLRRLVDLNAVNHLWSQTRDAPTNADRPCPTCLKPMRAARVAVLGAGTDGATVELDVCRPCQFVWFDAGEMGQLPRPAEPRVDAPLPPRAREILAREKVRRIAERAEQEGDELPSNPVDLLLAVLGMPVEHEVGPVARTPIVTWTVAALCVIVHLLAMAKLAGVIERFGMIPAQPLRYGGLTLLSSFFLHAGWFHLLSNMYFLVVFGDNVEDYVGRLRYVLLLLFATLAGDLLHLAFEPRADIPCVGASGGISGVIAFYALAFPQAKLGILFRWWLYFRWLRIPAAGAFAVWVMLQLLEAWLQVEGLSSVSALAHLGGAGVGVACWAFVRWQERRAKAEPRYV